MNRRIFALILGLGAAVLMAPTLAVAEDHLAEAISHTKEAIDHGKQGHADVLVTHAEAALKHAKAAEKAKDNPHTKQVSRISMRPLIMANKDMRMWRQGTPKKL